MPHPFIDGYQYTVLFQDPETQDTLDQVQLSNYAEARTCAIRGIKQEWEKHNVEIQATIIDNMNRSKPWTITRTIAKFL